MGIEEQKQIFQKLYNVPRETISQLSVYYDLLTHAQKTTNLIGSGSVKNIWLRHFADSAKLAEIMISHYKNMDRPLTFCDVGSGAGFPGLVLEIFNKNKDHAVFLFSISHRLVMPIAAVHGGADLLSPVETGLF